MKKSKTTGHDKPAVKITDLAPVKNPTAGRDNKNKQEGVQLNHNEAMAKATGGKNKMTKPIRRVRSGDTLNDLAARKDVRAGSASGDGSDEDDPSRARRIALNHSETCCAASSD